ncbi:class I SAM-dependent methyltransferase [bacterium SCSIO 12741]|nr:class I SAM-dependent methyltransferase [bacterium SCSIO 12741]
MKELFEKKKSLALDDPETSLVHREIILGKPFLKKLYTEWYDGFIQAAEKGPEGMWLEIGSGGGFLKDRDPRITTSDILPLGCDYTFSALDMPLEEGSVSALFMLNVFHHLPDVEQFLREAARVIKPGGIVYMVEPANTLWGRFFYQNIHHEPFDPNRAEWTFPSAGPLSDANGALPWIVFQRDRKSFLKNHPQWNAPQVQLHTPAAYLLSGGLSTPLSLPASLFSMVRLTERIFSPLNALTAMFQTITIVRSHES